MKRVSLRLVGVVGGTVFAWMIVQYGLFKAVFIVAGGVAGWLLARVLEGDLNLADYFRRTEGDDLE